MEDVHFGWVPHRIASERGLHYISYEQGGIAVAGAHELKIKYGLRNEPSDSLITRWAQVTRALTTQGFTLESAGVAAAKQLFPDFRTVVYASEADTIEALLRLAEGRG